MDCKVNLFTPRAARKSFMMDLRNTTRAYVENTGKVYGSVEIYGN